MPLRKSKEEIEKMWIGKVVAPEATKTRLVDIGEVAKVRMKRVVKVMSPVNDDVRDILDRYGIAGMRRMDYFNFARQAWKVFYEKSGVIAEKYFSAVWEYHKRTTELNEDIMREIVDAVRPHAERAKAEDLARKEVERKALLVEETNIIAGDSGVSSEVGDSDSSQANGAIGEG